MGFALGLVEGATAAVLVKKGFADVASLRTVNLAVAFVSGAPALSNVVSFMWANLAHGRERVRLLVPLLASFAVLVGFIGLAPRAAHGLAFAVVSIIAARVLWAGILTVRSAVWTANYPRGVLARVTGRIVMVSTLGVAGASALAGWVLEEEPEYTRWLYAAAALAGLGGAWLYRQMRVRREFRLLEAESAELGRSEMFSIATLRDILRQDPAYRRYMFWMGMYGAGNLMVTAQLVIILADQLHMPGATQIAILALVPLLVVPLCTPWWARLFDAGHVIEYRARQCWSLVAAIAVTLLGLLGGWTALLWIGAVLFGVANAGANLGWSLGHSDFASLGRMQHYMGVNVTLTGVRGLIAPPAGVLCYEWLERRWTGSGTLAVLLPLAMTFAGALGFNRMRTESMNKRRGGEE
jgi:MFS family permease